MTKRTFLTISAWSILSLTLHAQLQGQSDWKISASIESVTAGDLEVESYGDKHQGEWHKNMKAALNVTKNNPINKHLSWGISAGYRFFNVDFDFYGQDEEWKADHSFHTFHFGGGVQYNTTLWEKPLVLMGNIMTESSMWGLERVSGTGMAMLMLKATRDEMLGVGLAAVVNSTSSWPVYPIVVYRRLLSPTWAININYPFIGMQYIPDKKQTLTLGFTFDNDRIWLKPHHEELPRVVLFNRTSMRLGANYDYKLGNSSTLTLQGGWEYTIKAKFYHRDGHHKRTDFGNPNGFYAQAAWSYRF